MRQSRGDLIESIFLVRAYRTTLPRFGYSRPMETANMLIERRISATYKDLPGGQLLGPTFDYTHRLLDPALAGDVAVPEPELREAEKEETPRVTDILGVNGMIEDDGSLPEGHEPGDLTREPWTYPMERDLRLQALARGDEGFCWRSAIPRSAATATTTPSSARYALARSRLNSTCRNWALRFLLAGCN